MLIKNLIKPIFVISSILSSLLLPAQKNDTLKSAYEYSLKELLEVKISTSTIKKASLETVPANVTIITKEMIDERGYQTLVDICQDIPGFDFLMYNDAGGEYPICNRNRGLGEIGNPEILVMIDGIVQNSISFSWSLLWTYGNIFIDVDHIEIVQGPGSVLYGAQAFTGVINIITKKQFTGIEANSSCGTYNTWHNSLHFGTNLNNIHFSFAGKMYHSDGDNGTNRYDPGAYFTNNLYPNTILANYDNEGNYMQNIPNPLAGTNIPDGFNTAYNSYAIRSSITYKSTDFGFFIADNKRANFSAYSPYEYNLTDKECLSHFQSIHTYLRNKLELSPKLNLNSELVFRSTNILPVTGFKYNYRFPGLTKNYTSYAYQYYIEEKLLYEYSPKTSFYLGLKGAYNQKSDRVISLGRYDNTATTTNSSWDIALEQGGLNQIKEYPLFFEQEAAIYLLWDNNWLNNFYSSIGIRYDYSSNFGNIINPRISLLYKSKPSFGAKFIFGTAFRQAGIFELYNEFRGNSNLKPEKIKTSELEVSSLLFDSRVSLKTNIFYSIVSQYIGKVTDSTKPAGERFENLNQISIAGASIYFSSQLSKNIRFYSNYSYLVGIEPEGHKTYDLDKVAKFKMNAGINIKILKNKLTADFRTNYVGKRKARSSNTWIQAYENGYAPSYMKANLSVSYNFLEKFDIQLIANNLFNGMYYGLGRETASGFIDDYDPDLNIDPEGYLPAYHPQPGRTFLVNIRYQLK